MATLEQPTETQLRNIEAKTGAPDAAKPDPSVEPLDAIYTGAKSHQRAIHERLMAAIAGFGPFEVAPKKGYVSLRRARQFAMLGPKNARQFQLGINLKEPVDHPLAMAEKPGGMCQWVVLLEHADQADAGLLAVLRRAFDAAA